MAKQSPKSEDRVVPQATQKVTFGEYNGNPMFYVVYENADGRPDRFPTQLGPRKVRDVVGNISKAIEFLSKSDDQRDKDALSRFNAAFTKKGK
jgi:hypothetical protein